MSLNLLGWMSTLDCEPDSLRVVRMSAPCPTLPFGFLKLGQFFGLSCRSLSELEWPQAPLHRSLDNAGNLIESADHGRRQCAHCSHSHFLKRSFRSLRKSERYISTFQQCGISVRLRIDVFISPVIWVRVGVSLIGRRLRQDHGYSLSKPYLSMWVRM